MRGHCAVEHDLCTDACNIKKMYLHALLTIASMLLLPSPNTSSLADVCFGNLVHHSLMHLDTEFAFGLSCQLSMV